MKANPEHPSLQFKKPGESRGQEWWSARVILNYRALAIKRPDGYFWFWIGDHETYDSLISQKRNSHTRVYCLRVYFRGHGGKEDQQRAFRTGQ